MKVNPLFEQSLKCIEIRNRKTGRVVRRPLRDKQDEADQMFFNSYIQAAGDPATFLLVFEDVDGKPVERKVYTQKELKALPIPSRIKIASSMGADLVSDPEKLIAAILEKQKELAEGA